MRAVQFSPKSPLISLVAALLLALSWSGAIVARAEGPGVIEGRVVNATDGSKVLAGQAVVLHIFERDKLLDQATMTTDEQGRFRFTDLSTSPDYRYEVSVGYQGAEYASDLLRLDTAERHSMELPVYESTQSDEQIRLQQMVLFIPGVDPSTRRLSILELYTFRNLGDRTFVPSANGPAGAMGLLRFSLPPGVSDLQPDGTLGTADIFQVDRGIATTLPLAPGDTQVGFSYQVDYAWNALNMERTLPYPTAQFRVVYPEAALQVASPQLAPDQPADIGGKRYLALLGTDFGPRSQVSLTVSGLPLNVRLDQPVATATVLAALGLVLLLSLLLALGRRNRASIPAAVLVQTPQPEAERQQLLLTLAQLDEAFQAGRLSADAYRQQRDEAKQRLKSLLLAAGEGRGVVGT